MIRRIITIFFCVLLLLSMLIILIPPETQAQDEPVVIVGLDQSFRVADVSPNGTGEVIFTGTVSCEFNNATIVEVALVGSDTWNSAIVTPSSVEFSNEDPGAKTFQVSMTAPLGTSTQVVGKVVVTGSVIKEPGTLTGVSCIRKGAEGRIDIAPFYGFSVHCNDSSIDTEPGSEVTYELLVRNDGNSRDTFSISIKNDEELNDEGLEITLNATNIEMNEDEEKKVTINVRVPQNRDIINQEFEIEVEVISSIGLEESGLPPKSETLDLKIISDDKDNSGFLSGFEFMWIIACVFIVILITKCQVRKK